MSESFLNYTGLQTFLGKLKDLFAYKTHNHDGTYLPLAGGTMTGNIYRAPNNVALNGTAQYSVSAGSATSASTSNTATYTSGTAVYATKAGSAGSATIANTATYTSGTAVYATTAGSAGSASTSNTSTYTSGTAVYATKAGSAGTANTATYTSGTAVYATTAPWSGISGKPTAVSAFTNDSGYATTAYVNTAIDNLVGGTGISEALDTLNELANALGNDANFSTTVTNLIGTAQTTANNALPKAGGTMTGAIYKASGVALNGTAQYAVSAGSAGTANTATYTSGTAVASTKCTGNAATANTATYTSGTAVYATTAGSAGTSNTATYTSGTAVYASSAGSVAWGNVTGKPSTYTPASHTHYQLNTIGDLRNSTTAPNDYNNVFRFTGLKTNSAIGSPSADTYSYVMGMRGWSDSSGGNSHELAFNNTAIYTRRGATSDWSEWERITTSIDSISCIAKASYTGDYATTTTTSGSCTYFYREFAQVTATDWSRPWKIRMLVKAVLNQGGTTKYDQINELDFMVDGSTGNVVYHDYNTIKNTSYRAYHYLTILRPDTATKAGTAPFRLSFRAGDQVSTTANPRSYDVYILDTVNCTVKLNSTLDTTAYQQWYYDDHSTNAYYWSATSGGSFREYSINCCDNGLQETSDQNTYDRLYDTWYRPYSGTDAIYGYKLVMRGADNRLYPIVKTSGNGTGKVVQTVGLQPDSVWYYNSSGTTNASTVMPASCLYRDFPTNAMRYTFNEDCPAYRDVYLVGTLDAGTGLFTLSTTDSSGTASTTDFYRFIPTNTASLDLTSYCISGRYYLRIGSTYSSANYLQLMDDCALFFFNGTSLVPVTAKSIKSDVANTATYTSGTAVYATKAGSAGSATTANTATYTSGTAVYATKAGTANSVAYSNITGTPTIGNGTLTVKSGDSTVGTFSANQTGNTTLVIPTQTIPSVGSGTMSLYVGSTANSAGSFGANDTGNTSIVIPVDTATNATSTKPLTNSAITAALATKMGSTTIGNGTLTIQKNGTSAGTFTANQTGASTINILVPTAVSDLTNDTGFTTNVGTLTAVSMNGTAVTVTNNTAVLGTVITAHQSIAGKADKASITAGTAGVSTATSGTSFAIPYVAANSQGIVTGYGTHTHTISLSDIGAMTANTTIPAPANNGTLSILVNSSSAGTFTANQSTNTTVNIDALPTSYKDVNVVTNVAMGITNGAVVMTTNADCLSALNTKILNKANGTDNTYKFFIVGGTAISETSPTNGCSVECYMSSGYVSLKAEPYINGSMENAKDYDLTDGAVTELITESGNYVVKISYTIETYTSTTTESDDESEDDTETSTTVTTTVKYPVFTQYDVYNANSTVLTVTTKHLDGTNETNNQVQIDAVSMTVGTAIYANSAKIAPDYLPLAGGTMTGEIHSNTNALLRTVNDTAFAEICGGESSSTSPYVAVMGKTASSNPGCVVIRANDGTNTTTAICKPNGTMTWNGSSLSLTKNGTSYIGKSTNTNAFFLQGGTAYNQGSFLRLNGGSQTSQPGYFQLGAYADGSGVYLYGKPDGSLTWKGNEVVTESKTSFSFTKATGYTINTQRCYIQNNIVTIYISITTPSSVTSGWQTFATLPSSVKNAVSFDVYWDQPVGSSGNARSCRFTTSDFGLGAYITSADASKTIHIAITVIG